MNNATFTFLFTDIEGSTQLWEQHPAAMQTALARHDAILRGAIEAHNGQVFKTVGDAFCAAFTSATDALMATLEAQQTLNTEKWGDAIIKVRMGLHSGPAEQRDNDYFGPTLNRVARLMSAGHGGQTLLSAATRELVQASLPEGIALREMGEHRLKDLINPEHLFQLNIPGLPVDFPAIKTLEVRLTNLPERLSHFIGREKDVAQVRQSLGQSRLVTLTGSGGVGKTRLAIQAASELLDQYPNGVWLVELAPITDPEWVAQAVCVALDLSLQRNAPPLAVLTGYLQSKKLLLVVDNCEHLINASAQICETLLHTCPGLRILASSREALGVDGETAYRVPSLSVPDPRSGLESIKEAEAVQLFVERAAVALPGFELTAANAQAVAQVCKRLDGIALALELAASRVKMLKVEQIASRLDDVFRLLTGGSRTALPRQQTLRALIDWSYNLLSEEERAVLRSLSVFVGGWTLEAAEYVGNTPYMLDVLTRLMDKSLVAVDFEGDGEPRYFLLETIRQYAREKLNESGESEPLRTRQMEYFCQLVERFAPKLRGPDQVALLDALEMELENLRATLEWALGQHVAAGLRLAYQLKWFWHLRNYFNDGIAWLAMFISAGAKQPGSFVSESNPSDWVRALLALAYMEGNQGEFQKTFLHARESLAFCEKIPGMVDSALGAECFQTLAACALIIGDPTQAKTLSDKSLDIYQACGDKFGIAELQSIVLISLALHSGEFESAQRVSESHLAIRKELGDKDGIGYAFWCGGIVALHQGDYEGAKQNFMDAIEASHAAKSNAVLGMSLGNLGISCLLRGEIDLSRKYILQAVQLAQEKWIVTFRAYSVCWLALYWFEHKQFHKFTQLNSYLEGESLIYAYFFLAPVIPTILKKNLAVARAALSEAEFQQAESKGKSLTLDQALAYALEGIDE